MTAQSPTNTAPTILQVIPELETGGAELSAIEVADAITSAGGRTIVVSKGGRMEPLLKEAGGELIRMDVATKNPWALWRNGKEIAAIARREQVHLLHARSRAPAWSTLFAARQTGLPFITTYHGAYNEASAAKRLYNSVMVRGRLVIANSAYTAGLIEQRYRTPKDRIRIIHRGVDASFDPALVGPDRIAAIRRRWGIAPGLRIILLAGRLTAWKGQRVLIDAFAELDRQDLSSDAIVVLAGDHQGRENYRAELADQIEKSGLTGHVLMVGHEDDMPAAFGAAHIAVVASTDPEAFGRTAIEAQAMACPVIATRHGAPPETVIAPPDAGPHEQTGWLATPGDASDLARHLAQALALADDQRREIGARARANVQARFTSRQMKSKTLAVYNEVLSAQPAALHVPLFSATNS